MVIALQTTEIPGKTVLIQIRLLVNEMTAVGHSAEIFGKLSVKQSTVFTLNIGTP